MICARAWPTGATRQRNPFPPFFARVFQRNGKQFASVTESNLLVVLTYHP